jgi:hypothetical protein
MFEAFMNTRPNHRTPFFFLAWYMAALTLITLPAAGQIEEPILTKSALVFVPASGSVKLDYAGSLIHAGATSQIIPEFTVQAGIFQRVEGILRFPLLRVEPGNGATVIGGGQLAAGAKFLLMGDPGTNAAISVQGVVEAPTGDSRLVGDATQVMPEILADWRLTRHIVSYTNVSWDLSLGGTGKRVSLITYESALALATRLHLEPVLEFAGSTNSSTGRILAVVEPDLLFRKRAHFELKLGVPAGLNSNSPALGLHAQLAIFWGKTE